MSLCFSASRFGTRLRAKEFVEGHFGATYSIGGAILAHSILKVVPKSSCAIKSAEMIKKLRSGTVPEKHQHMIEIQCEKDRPSTVNALFSRSTCCNLRGLAGRKN